MHRQKFCEWFKVPWFLLLIILNGFLKGAFSVLGPVARLDACIARDLSCPRDVICKQIPISIFCYTFRNVKKCLLYYE